MKLSRKIPAKMLTLKAQWCRQDFMEMSDHYRTIRAKLKNPMCSCYWCKHEFENGEMMALACFENKGNKTLCQACAKELIDGI